jgi:hypothetical protein
MNTERITIRTLIALLVLSHAACQSEEMDAAASAPIPKLATDADLGHGYVRRDGAIHFIGGGTTGTGADATRIDMPSPMLLKKVVDSQFGSFKTTEGLDVASFEALSEEYTRDKDRVYHKVISPGVFLVIVLPEADPASFEVLASNLARDRKHVWYYERSQPGADPSTLEVVNERFAVFKDKDSVHYQSERIAGADPASFRHLGSGYYRDKNRVYWGPEPVPDTDPATFKVLGDSFVAKDKHSVYRSGGRLADLDVATTELILHNHSGYQILSDKNGIHLNAWTFPRSKPGNAEVIDEFTVKVGDLIHTVSMYQFTPVTVFREDGKLRAEAPCYEPGTYKLLGMITAEVTGEGLKDIRTVPLPGHGQAPTAPDWQLRAFERPDLVQRMIGAGKLLK